MPLTISTVCAAATLLLCSLTFTVAQQNKCIEKLDQTFQCVEDTRNSADAQTLDKKKDDILDKCAPDLPPQCKAMKKAGQQCQQKLAADEELQTLRSQVKQGVAKCFDQFGGNTSAVAAGGNPTPPRTFDQPPPPPPGSPGGPDNCRPKDDQMGCIKMEMRNDKDAREIAMRLEQKERDCYNGAIDSHCLIDGSNAPLRDCVGNAEQPFLQKSSEKMQQCMQAAVADATKPSSG